MNTRRRRNRDSNSESPALTRAQSNSLRIIGGELRGRQLRYSGDPRTRPMKDNVREAVFNLIGAWVPGRLAIDLFSGSGALGIEALSRGALHAIFIERHIPTAQLIEENLQQLQLESRGVVIAADTFFWGRQLSSEHPPYGTSVPWLVFCSPPYDLYVQRAVDLIGLLQHLIDLAPSESVFVVESDTRFDGAQLPYPDRWRRRSYSPAVVHVLRPSAALC